VVHTTVTSSVGVLCRPAPVQVDAEALDSAQRESGGSVPAADSPTTCLDVASAAVTEDQVLAW